MDDRVHKTFYTLREGILPDLTNRDEPILTGPSAVKVMLRPLTSRNKMSSS